MPTRTETTTHTHTKLRSVQSWQSSHKDNITNDMTKDNNNNSNKDNTISARKQKDVDHDTMATSLGHLQQLHMI